MIAENGQRVRRNWMAYLMDALVNSGAMPSWDAAEYLTRHLIGDAPNTHLHETKSPHETMQQFLQRVYGPIVEAATRSEDVPKTARVHLFTDISLIGNSAVLVVYFPDNHQPHQLLLLDGVRAWDLMFQNTDQFNEWAEERYRWISEALKAISKNSAVSESAELSLALSS